MRLNSAKAALGLLAVAAPSLPACRDSPRQHEPDTLPITVPREPIALEDVVALARAYTEQEFSGSGQIWLHHVNAPNVHRDGTVVLGDHPIEITFTMRRAHDREVCQTLELTSRGWTGRMMAATTTGCRRIARRAR